MQSKRYEDEGRQTWRYAEIFKVVIDGEDPILVAAQNCRQAVDLAAEEIGMDRAIAKKMATVQTPTAQELVNCARAKGLMLEMQVRLPGYPDHICNAFCRMEAVMDAANTWGLLYADIKSKATVGVSRRTPC